jgi:hypothetical protein
VPHRQGLSFIQAFALHPVQAACRLANLPCRRASGSVDPLRQTISYPPMVYDARFQSRASLTRLVGEDTAVGFVRVGGDQDAPDIRLLR